mgnify:CR=1 FL=1
MIDGSFVGVAAKRPPVKEFVEARRLEGRSATQQNESFSNQSLVFAQVALYLRETLGDRHLVVLLGIVV